MRKYLLKLRNQPISNKNKEKCFTKRKDVGVLGHVTRECLPTYLRILRTVSTDNLS